MPDLNKYVTNDNIISRNYVTEIYLNNKNYIKNTDSFKVDNDNNSESLITINKSIFKDVLNIKDESSSILYIENNGNIGIGTNKPNYKLDVNGIISGDGSKIKNINVNNLTGKIQEELLSEDVLSIITERYLNNNNIYLDNCNFSIGNKNPDNIFQVTNNNSNLLEVSNNEVILGCSLIPSLNNTFDIGKPDKKIRDIYLSENSLWIGDTHKMVVSEGEVKFRKRVTNVVPTSIINAGGSEQGVFEFLNRTSLTTITNLSEITLANWTDYMIYLSHGNQVNIGDIFTENIEDYESESLTSIWNISDNTSNIYLNFENCKLGIGNENPIVSLDILSLPIILISRNSSAFK